VKLLLGVYNDRPWQRYHLHKVLKIVLGQGVRPDGSCNNPAKLIKNTQPKTKVEIWELADVAAHVQAALDAEDPDLAAMIQLEWDIGQRLTDLILFRHGAQYKDGMFSFKQSKTDAPVTFPIKPSTAALIDGCRREGSLYLFHDKATGRPYKEVDRLWHVYDAIRPEGSTLTMRTLRHSAVVQMSRAGCTVPEIAAVTGHTILSVTKILATYLPRDAETATNAMRKRWAMEEGLKLVASAA
jgi:hypothetical protein